MKRKLVQGILLVIVICGLLSGCKKSETTNDKEGTVTDGKKDEKEYNLEDFSYPGKTNSEEIVFSCGNYNLNIYSEYSPVQSLEVNVYSYQELSTENVQVYIEGINSTHEAIMSEMEYKKDEYKQMLKKVLSVCNTEKTPEEISALDISSIPKIKHYVLIINFDMLHDDSSKAEEFNAINVVIDNKEYKVNVGTVKLIYGEIEQFKNCDEGEGVTGQTGGAYGFPIDPNYPVNNSFEYSGFMFNTVTDIEITDIGILNDSTLTMKDTTLQVSGDMSMEIEYEKGKTIKVKKDSMVNINMQLFDEKLSNPLTYRSTAIVYMKYKYDNKEYTVINTPVFRTNYSPYEVYAQMVDGIDVVGYYKALADDDK